MNMKTTDDGVDPTTYEVATSSLAAPGAKAPASDRLGKAEKKRRRKAARLRAVWISFTGRILAQFVGASASILLGMMLIHNYKAPAQGTEKAALAREPAAYEGRVARTGDAAGRPRPSIVVLPMDDYALAATGDRFAQALTELVTASLAERGSLVVLSRTSASRVAARHGSVPAIAREFGVDLVLEASVTRTADRVRVVAQLIDGRSDEHLWAGRFDGATGDTLGLQSDIAARIARSVDAAVSGSALRPAIMTSRWMSVAPDGFLDRPRPSVTR
jgi:TolB-like protein